VILNGYTESEVNFLLEIEPEKQEHKKLIFINCKKEDLGSPFVCVTDIIQEGSVSSIRK